MLNEVNIKKYMEDGVLEQTDFVIAEHRANIFVNDEHYISLMCLPQGLKELAVGFLFAEGIVSSYDDVEKIDTSSPDNIYVFIKNDLCHTKIGANVVISTRKGDSCPNSTKKGRRVIVSGFAQGSVNLPFFDCTNLAAANSSLRISPDEIRKMMSLFNKQSELFAKTGAVHSCSLLLPDGTNIFYEDIGRHNAIDKIIGQALISALCIKDGVLLTSGRISSEILIKAAGLGLPVLISLSAPTNMAVEIARKANMTLIGFARGNRFNVYAGNMRITQ
jgi:FdhD protein